MFFRFAVKNKIQTQVRKVCFFDFPCPGVSVYLLLICEICRKNSKINETSRKHIRYNAV